MLGLDSTTSVAGVGIGALLAVIATILICIMVMPEKRKGSLNKFFKWVHDIVNFKSLLIEKIIKVFYIFSTCAVLFTGFFSMFSGGRNALAGILGGLLCMIIGPFVVRIIYEAFMMFILLVQNTISIRNKICTDNTETKKSAPAEPKFEFCTECGTRFDTTQGGCPKCNEK